MLNAQENTLVAEPGVVETPKTVVEKAAAGELETRACTSTAGVIQPQISLAISEQTVFLAPAHASALF